MKIKRLIKLLGFLSLIFLMVTLVYLIILGGGFGEKDLSSKINGGCPIAFAHRGVPIGCVENSLESIRKSQEIGFQSIEIDLRNTEDEKVVVFHDKYCKRLLGEQGIMHEKKYDAIKQKQLLYNNEPSGSQILTLTQFFREFKNHESVYVDIKRAHQFIADSLITLIQKYNAFDVIYIADANPFFLGYIEHKDPRIQTVQEGFSGKELLYWLIPKGFKTDFYASSLSGYDMGHLSFLEENNLSNKVIAYGVNKDNLEEAQKLGLKAVIVDYDVSLGKYEDIISVLNNEMPSTSSHLCE